MKPARKKKSAVNRKDLQAKGPASSSQPLSRGKLWLFRLLVAVGVPLVFLGAIELVLRLIGFGYPTSFLLPSQRDGQDVFIQNNQFGWRFFGAAMARIPESFCIPRVKGANTVRIIVFGESAAQGDPEPRFGLPRMLQAMLELRYPGVRFEVVNAGVVAINSNVILPIARDCTAANADIWVIYMGNNEVVGPFGAGTVFGGKTPPLPLIRASLALKSTRIGQLIDDANQKIHQPPKDKSQWGGMEMFLNQQVRSDDPAMSAVYDHFVRNLHDIIRMGRRNGAGIVVSTVAVNLRNCAPFGSEHQRDLTDADQSKWDVLYQKGIAAQLAGNNREAEESFQAAAQIDDHFAELRFRQGCCAQALGETSEAQKEFAAACDEDTLRFRCDSRLNNLIRQTVSTYGNPEVVLADGEQALAEQSADGLPGQDLFYDHVHMTFDGNYLLARAIVPGLEDLLPASVAAHAPAGQPWPSEADCARRLAWSDWDKEDALANMLSRLSKPPFTGQLDHGAQVQYLKDSLDKLMPAMQPAGMSAAKGLCESALAAAPDDALLYEQLATLDESSGDLAAAETNAQRAVELLPGSGGDWAQLGAILAEQQKYDGAETAYRRAFQLNSEDVWALQYIAQSLKHLGRRDEAIREYQRAVALNPRFGMAWLGLGQTYEEMGRTAEANDCYSNAVANPIDHNPELKILARFCESRGWYGAAATNYDQALRLTPLDAKLYLEAGQNLSAWGHHAEAEQRYAEAAKLAPDLMEAHFLYGLELGRDGKVTEAADEFREAVRLAPNLPEARLNLGMALEIEGKYSEALAQFEKVLEQSPGNALALQHAQALRQKLSGTQTR